MNFVNMNRKRQHKHINSSSSDGSNDKHYSATKAQPSPDPKVTYVIIVSDFKLILSCANSIFRIFKPVRATCVNIHAVNIQVGSVS